MQKKEIISGILEALLSVGRQPESLRRKIFTTFFSKVSWISIKLIYRNDYLKSPGSWQDFFFFFFPMLLNTSYLSISGRVSKQPTAHSPAQALRDWPPWYGDNISVPWDVMSTFTGTKMGLMTEALLTKWYQLSLPCFAIIRSCPTKWL